MMKQKKDKLHSYRCNCGKLLFRGFLLDSTIQIKCKKCGKLMSFQGANDLAAPDNSFAIMFDRNGAIISASSNIQKLFGYSLSELLAKNYSDLLVALPKKVMRLNFDRLWALPHKERYYFKSKVSHRRKDGGIISGIVQSKFVKTANDMMIFSVFHSGEKASETPETEPEFFALHEYPFFLQVSRDGIFLDASIARKRPHNRPRSEIVGKPFVMFMHESVAEREKFMHQLQQGEPFELIGKNFSRVDGTSVCMDAFFTPNFDKDGQCTDYSVYVFHHELITSYDRQLAARQAT